MLDKQVERLEMDLSEIKDKVSGMDKELSNIKENVDTILKLVQKMNGGLYGDEENMQEGVIKRQYNFEKDLKNIKDEISAIHKKSSEQSIEIKAKKSLRSEILETLREIVKWGLNALVLYLILKGVMNPDSLIKT